jgi:membrane associated rhomboid family serine protease
LPDAPGEGKARGFAYFGESNTAFAAGPAKLLTRQAPSLAKARAGRHPWPIATTFMFGNEYSEDQRPITHLAGYPIYAATLLIVIYVVSLLATTIAMALGYGELLSYYLEFDSRLVLAGGQVWRFFTYGLWNVPSLNFVIDMVMFVWFGREVEKFFGRKVFLRFYAILYLLQPIVYTLLGLIRPTTLVGETGAFAFFLAFATLYPNAALLFNILAKWMAIVLVGLYSLMALAARDVVALVALWVTVGYSYSFIRHEQGRWNLPKLRFPRSKAKLRVLPSPQNAPRESPSEDSTSEIDALLDKIATSGLASLTTKERTRLEKARTDLLKKDQR